MSETIPLVIEMYADLTCPYAYLTHYRLREVLAHSGNRVAIRHRSLALEYVNRRPTPKRAIEAELPFLMLAEPEIPYRPWAAPASEWPVTVWPAFEAVTCAARQSLALADDLAWTIRSSFFGENRCIALRHVLLDLGEQIGLDLERFTADFDSGIAKQQVIDDARSGWETTVRVPGSPTLVLPSGEQIHDLGLPEVSVDEGSGKVTDYRPATRNGSEARDLLQQMIERA